jgi:hypothetical protein
MSSIRDFLKSLRMGFRAFRFAFHNSQWKAKRRRAIPDYMKEPQ